jgi:hypothetical protein
MAFSGQPDTRSDRVNQFRHPGINSFQFCRSLFVIRYRMQRPSVSLYTAYVIA